MYEQNIEQLLTGLKQLNDQTLTTLMHELTYGKNIDFFNTNILQKSSIVLYLHETNPEILVGIDKSGNSKVLDIKRMKFTKSNNKYEIKYGLPFNKYLIIEDSDDQIILLFKQQADKDNFYSSALKLVAHLCKVPSEIDSVTMKSFIKADTNSNLMLSIEEIKNMFKKIKFEDDNQIENLLNFIYLENKYENLTFKDFQVINKILNCKKEMIPIFQTYTGFLLGEHRALLEKVMDRNAFISFLMETQEENEASANKIAKKFYKYKDSKLSFSDFCLYLNSHYNDITSQKYFDYDMDTSQPLTSYICYSSHNTYLTGNQLTSDSRAQRYYQDIYSGVRCVQIDTHDGEDGPIVKHGYTVTTSITFQEVIQQIRKACQQLENSHTPIIISIENHCNNENQKKMGEILEQQFKGKLVLISQYKTWDSPSLKNLLGRIIVKCSGTYKTYYKSIQSQKDIVIGEADQQKYNESQGEENQIQDISAKCISQLIIKQLENDKQFTDIKKRFDRKIKQLGEEKKMFDEQRNAVQIFIKKYHMEQKVDKEMKVINRKLLSLTAMLSNGTLGAPSFWESVSLNENTIIRYYNQNRNAIQNHSQKGWIRSYPKGSRLDSSNYNPFPSLQMGIQIIAINTQVADYPSLILKKYFEKGMKKTAGYRLKPDIPKQNQLTKIQVKQISLTPLSAMRIYYNNMLQKHLTPPCQIRMRLYCYGGDIHLNEENIEWKNYTEIIRNNAFSPIFEKRQTMNIRYTCQQLTFVVVQIKEAGMGVIPIQKIKKGYRTITLYDHQLKPKDSKILFYIQ